MLLDLPQPPRLDPVLRRHDLVALRPEDRLQRLPGGCLVFHEQDLHRAVPGRTSTGARRRPK